MPFVGVAVLAAVGALATSIVPGGDDHQARPAPTTSRAVTTPTPVMGSAPPSPEAQHRLTRFRVALRAACHDRPRPAVLAQRLDTLRARAPEPERRYLRYYLVRLRTQIRLQGRMARALKRTPPDHASAGVGATQNAIDARRREAWARRLRVACLRHVAV